MTKNEQVLGYIKNLEIGTKISVRQIAQELDVSEGTAYKAIKDAEIEELVSTIPRVGTIRIEKIEKSRINEVTFNEVMNMVEGQLLGGREGIYKIVHKFVIGAMGVNEISRYISAGDLLIVGNRDDVHRLALEKNCAIMITGGFSCKEEIKRIANEKKLPIISTSYDTFTIASLINRNIHERLIKKEIIVAEDIMPPKVHYLEVDQRVSDMKALMKQTGHLRFPVIDGDQSVVGIVAPIDIAGASDEEFIVSLMTKSPITVVLNTSVAYISHIMIWEGIEMIPVTEAHRLVGVITRQDVIKGLRSIGSQPHMGEAFEDMLMNQCRVEEICNGIKIIGNITPMMLNEQGIAGAGVLVTLMSTAGSIAVKNKSHLNSLIDSFTVYFIKPLQLDSKIEIDAEVINRGRNFYKVDLSVRHNGEIVSKAMMSAKIMKR